MSNYISILINNAYDECHTYTTSGYIFPSPVSIDTFINESNIDADLYTSSGVAYSGLSNDIEEFDLITSDEFYFNTTVEKPYLSESIKFYYINSAIQIDYKNDFIKYKNQYIRTNKIITLVLTNVDKDKILNLKNKNILNRILYIYDSSGVHINNNLLKCIITKMPTVMKFDDMFDITIQCYEVV